MERNVIIGSRGSDLALWQARYTQQKLQDIGVSSTIKIIKTQGDRIQHLSFDKMEGKGFFTKEIEASLLSEEIDLAVHSHKDLETTSPDGLTIAAVSYREDPRDVLLISKAHFSPDNGPLFVDDNAIIGTSSARRKAQLHHLMPSLKMEDIRGNVPTRIDKLRQGNFHAIVLAAAGLQRLEIDTSEFESVYLNPEDFVPAPAQGVLAFQTRNADKELIEILQSIHDHDVASCIEQERTGLRNLDGGCQLPFGMYVSKSENEYQSWGFLQQGATAKRVFMHCTNPSGLGDRMHKALIESTKFSCYISRNLEDCPHFSSRLNAYANVMGSSQIGFEKKAVTPWQASDEEWLFFTSKNGVKFIDETMVRAYKNIGVIGPGTAKELSKTWGISAQYVARGTQSTLASIQEFYEIHNPTKVCFAVGDSSRHHLKAALEERGVIVQRKEVYHVSNAAHKVERADKLVFTSTLNATYFLEANGDTPKDTLCVAIGENTYDYLTQQGFTNVAKSWSHTEEALADTVLGA